ncbi:topoisomerase C-terminal repeat-containing protein [Escherichia coli]|nr:type IA DNA topoisomerase [Salmonella enterica]EFC3187903.1 type IA DNA topoisomerase [Escherichia coli]EBD9380848.1 type IA DNA topoisomerase [Salmonella enterica]EBT5153627.1 type IA DNA topoisomerase [Salmonella enterica]EFJ5405577.1 type IA DNA topoisomerase [Escherichia coli]
MILTIAEKPELAEIIAKAFGGEVKKSGYWECANNNVVTWCYGHMLVLTPPDKVNPSYKTWVMSDLPMDLTEVSHEVKTTENGYVERQYKIITDLLRKSSSVINAGDPDDEGELLVREILWKENYNKPVQRLLLNDLNVNAAKKALSKLQDGNSEKFMRLALKALARAKGDQIYGLNMTRYYTLLNRQHGGNGKLTCGRVQTPMLGLIVKRYEDFKNHVKSNYYDVYSSHNILKSVYLKLIADDKFATDGKILSPEVAENIKSACVMKPSTVVVAKVEDKHTPPPLPFDLLGLQAYMLKDDIDPTETMEITQKLRSKEIAAISYNRSDCRYLTSDQYDEAPATLEALKKYISGGILESVINNNGFDIKRKGIAFNDDNVSAHTGIIPSAEPRNLDKLTSKEKKVYEAIVLRYLLQFLDDKKYQSAKVIIECEGYRFGGSATKLVSPGWTALEAEDSEDDSAEENTDSAFDAISAMKVDDVGVCNDIRVDKKETKPLPVYTMKTFLEDLKRVSRYVTDPHIKQLLLSKDKGKKGERGGIGTPATRATIISNLESTGYFTVQNGKLIPTEKGIGFIKNLPVAVSAPDMTALWHEQQMMIMEGDLELGDFIININNTVKELMNPELSQGIVSAAQNFADNKPVGKCFCCSSEMKLTPKVYACQNEGCGFKIWRKIAEKELTDNQMQLLMNAGRTKVIKGFKSKAGKSFEAALVIDKEQKRVTFEFAARKA